MQLRARNLPKILFTLLLLLVSKNSHAASFVQLDIEGVIHEGTVQTISDAILKTKNEKAQALLITLDTPGGILESTRKIVKLFLNDEVPIIVYVSPSGSRAGSAGTFITLAADVAAMAPGTNIGAAHPVTATGKDPEEGGKHMAQKIENDTIAFIESIAKQKNRNVEWAKKAVLDSASIGEQEAKKMGVIDVVASSVSDLLTQIDGKKILRGGKETALDTKNATISKFSIDLKNRLLNLLAHPTTMMILMAIIGLGLYVEFSHPGLIFPAAASIISIFLMLISTSIIPITMVGTILIALGFICLMVELFVVSYGLLTIGGVALFVSGSMLLFDPTTSDLSVSRYLIWSMAAGVGIVGAILAIMVGSTVKLPQQMGLETLVGIQTKILSSSDTHEKKVFIHGEYWNVKCSEPLPPETEVIVTAVNGLTLTVKKANH